MIKVSYIKESLNKWKKEVKPYHFNSAKQSWVTLNVDDIIWEACEAAMKKQHEEKVMEILKMVSMIGEHDKDCGAPYGEYVCNCDSIVTKDLVIDKYSSVTDTDSHSESLDQ